MQRVTPRSSVPDFDSVQGIIEFGLNKILKTKNSLFISSRTDSGVHAIASTAAFDYHCKKNTLKTSPNFQIESLIPIPGPDADPTNKACPEKLCESLNTL